MIYKDAVLTKIESLSNREKMLLLITGVVVVFLLGFSFVIEPLLKSQEISDRLLENALSEQKLLDKQLKNINKSKKIEPVSTVHTVDMSQKHAHKSTQMSVLLEKLLLQSSELQLISLESTLSDLVDNSSHPPVERYQLHIIGRYPAMINYISELENLPFSIQFEDFKYRLRKFPDADIYVTVVRYDTATVLSPSAGESK